MGLKRTSNERFFWLTGPTNQSRPIANLFNFYIFRTIWLKYGVCTANAPALLLLFPCSCLAPGLLLACSQPTPGLLLLCSWSCPSQFGSLHQHQHFTTFSGTAIAAFYGIICLHEKDPSYLNGKVAVITTSTTSRVRPPLYVSSLLAIIWEHVDCRSQKGQIKKRRQ